MINALAKWIVKNDERERECVCLTGCGECNILHSVEIAIVRRQLEAAFGLASHWMQLQTTQQ